MCRLTGHYPLLSHHGTFPLFSMIIRLDHFQVSVILQITENLAAILPKINQKSFKNREEINPFFKTLFREVLGSIKTEQEVQGVSIYPLPPHKYSLTHYQQPAPEYTFVKISEPMLTHYHHQSS